MLLLILKEIHFQLRNIAFYIFVLVFIFLYFVSVKLPSKDDTIAPLSNTQFMYKTMIQDYNTGVVFNELAFNSFKNNSEQREIQQKLLTVILNTEQKELLLQSLLKMSTVITEQTKDIININFSETTDYYTDIYRQLDKELGGNTYYGDTYRELYCYEYNTNNTPVESVHMSAEEEIQLIYNSVLTTYNGYVTEWGNDVDEPRKLFMLDSQKPYYESALTQIESILSNSKSEQDYDAHYEEYTKIISNLDNELGGNTFFNKSNVESLAYKKKTFDEIQKDFELTINTDIVSNAYARVFADKIAIILMLLCVSVSGFIIDRDKSNKMEQIVYNKKISATTYIMSKYIAIVLMIFVCCVFVSLHATFKVSSFASFNGYAMEYLSFLKYSVTWVLPTLMFSIALGMLISVVFNNGIIAIPVFFGLFYLSLFPLIGDYRFFKPVIRYSIFGDYTSYLSWLPQIVVNRLFFTLISIVVLWITCCLYEKRRDGFYVVFN